MSGPRVLAVDDEPALLRAVRLTLTGNGYQVVTAASGEEALAEVARQIPDIMLLDLMLPGIDGLEVVRRVREHSTAPIIVLSARGDEAIKVRALDLGADDYISKPFGAGELVARVRVALRHATGRVNAAIFRAADLQVDFEHRRVLRAGVADSLTAKETAVLRCLVANAGRVLTHRMILREVWGPEFGSETQYLRNVITALRRKIEPDPTRPSYILTETGTGYRFTSPSD